MRPFSLVQTFAMLHFNNSSRPTVHGQTLTFRRWVFAHMKIFEVVLFMCEILLIVYYA